MLSEYMKRAIEIGKQGNDPTTKNGAIIVGPDGKILAEGFTHLPPGYFGLPDPTDKTLSVHAEVDALFKLKPLPAPKGTTLYSVFEPCTNCLKFILYAGIDTVHFVDPITPKWTEANRQLYIQALGIKLIREYRE